MTLHEKTIDFNGFKVKAKNTNLTPEGPTFRETSESFEFSEIRRSCDVLNSKSEYRNSKQCSKFEYKMTKISHFIVSK